MALLPEAPLFDLAFSIWAVAMALVPKAMTSMRSSNRSLSFLITADPMPPPWPSITHTFFLVIIPIFDVAFS
jgi:hypothetical protein